MADRQSNLKSRKRNGKRKVSDRADQTDGGPKCRKIAPNPPDTTIEMIKKENLPSKDDRWNPDKIPVDILVMTAIECELMAVLSFIPRASRMYKKGLGKVYMGNVGTMKIAVMRCKMGSNGTRGSGQLVQKAVTELMPKAVFCVGYCGGLNPDKLKLGDVVISEKLITYETCKLTEGGIKDRSDRVPLKTNLASVIQSAADGWRAPLQDPTELDVDVRCGTLLSGSKVVDNNQMREELLKRFPEGIAIEMEGEGVYAAAHNLDVEWVIIKGVSDFADGKKSNTDDWRPFASLMAASLAVHFISNSVVFEDWPHYNGAKSSLPSSSGERVENAGRHGSGSVPSSKGKKKPRSRDTDSMATSSSTTAEKRKAVSPSTDKKVPKRSKSSPSEATGSKQSEATPPRSTDVIKDGVPKDEDLQFLSMKLGEYWKYLAHCLGFEDPEITAFHKQNEELREKAYKMLIKWRAKCGSGATYSVLYDALCDERVGQTELAQRYCCLKKS